jgi:hypothetical protein
LSEAEIRIAKRSIGFRMTRVGRARSAARRKFTGRDRPDFVSLRRLGRGLRFRLAAAQAQALRGDVEMRPILMTSFAFILGCVPLALASGASANARISIGSDRPDFVSLRRLGRGLRFRLAAAQAQALRGDVEALERSRDPHRETINRISYDPGGTCAQRCPAEIHCAGW